MLLNFILIIHVGEIDRLFSNHVPWLTIFIILHPKFHFLLHFYMNDFWVQCVFYDYLLIGNVNVAVLFMSVCMHATNTIYYRSWLLCFSILGVFCFFVCYDP